MVIAMIAMGVVQVAIHQIIGVVAMGDRLMPAIGTMNMSFLVAANIAVASATIRVLGINLNHMFINMIS
jgi:hypothetical protein